MPLHKIPESVLVVIHTPELRVLVLERADHPGYWQSVTGSKDAADEPLAQTCRREVLEETGIDIAGYPLRDWNHVNRYEIFMHWRHRYAQGVTHNTEHVFSVEVPEPVAVTVAPREHLGFAWLPWQEAAERCFSWSNVTAIRELPARTGRGSGPAEARGHGGRAVAAADPAGATPPLIAREVDADREPHHHAEHDGTHRAERTPGKRGGEAT